jgi:hypothetical protein
MSFFQDRQMVLRAILIVIIVGAIPFYLVGILLLASSNGTTPAEPTAQPSATFTPLGAGNTDTPTPTLTPTRFVTNTPFGVPLDPTPPQFIPPTNPPPPTATIFIPTETPAPTLTTVGDSDSDGLIDTNDNCPNTPGPVENNGCPLPTATPTLTHTATSTSLPPPSDTPTHTPTITRTPTAPPTPTATITPSATNPPLPTDPLPTATDAADAESTPESSP